MTLFPGVWILMINTYDMDAVFLYKNVQPNIQTTNQNDFYMSAWILNMNIHDSLMETLDFQALSLILYSLSLNPRSSVRTAENAERTTTFVMFRISGFADIPEILNGLSNSWKQETSFDTQFSLRLNLDTCTTIQYSLAQTGSVCFKRWRWRVWSLAASYHRTSANGDSHLTNPSWWLTPSEMKCGEKLTEIVRTWITLNT